MVPGLVEPVDPALVPPDAPLVPVLVVVPVAPLAPVVAVAPVAAVVPVAPLAPVAEPPGKTVVVVTSSLVGPVVAGGGVGVDDAGTVLSAVGVLPLAPSATLAGRGWW